VSPGPQSPKNVIRHDFGTFKISADQTVERSKCENNVRIRLRTKFIVSLAPRLRSAKQQTRPSFLENFELENSERLQSHLNTAVIPSTQLKTSRPLPPVTDFPIFPAPSSFGIAEEHPFPV
jgi:hypothetical protein